MFSCPPVSLPCSWPCNLAHWTLWTWQPCVEQAIRFLQSLQRLPLPIIMNDFDSFPFDGKVMEPFASSGPLQIIVDLLWLKSGGWNALPAPPLALPCPPQEISPWHPGIRGGQHRTIWLMKCRQQSGGPFASGWRSPSQESKPTTCASHLAALLLLPTWSTQPGVGLEFPT